MKKTILLAIFSCLFATINFAQDNMGYRTTDLGVEASGSDKNASLLLHIAFNAKVHNAFVLRAGYYLFTDHPLNQSGGGPLCSAGYRYYFLVRPHGFFLGLRADLMHLKIDAGDFSTTTWSLLPAGETGYQALINDKIFITPFFSAGILSHMQTKGPAVSNGFRWQAGVSAGVKI